MRNNKVKMDAEMQQAIVDVAKTLRSSKNRFFILNGGWEKHFENELAFILHTKLNKYGYTVSMQHKRADITVINNIDNVQYIIEIGHYTLNQTKIKKVTKFKPSTDVQKASLQNCPNFYHVMLLEKINVVNFKYGNNIKSSIKHYRGLYPKKLEIIELIKYNNKGIDGFIVLSKKIKQYKGNRNDTKKST